MKLVLRLRFITIDLDIYGKSSTFAMKVFKNRKTNLRNKIEKCLITSDIDGILKAVDDYEKDNLSTIEKLKRDKKIELNRINGALKMTINAHGPITKLLIGSAGKRIHGALLNDDKPNWFEKIKKFFRKWKK